MGRKSCVKGSGSSSKASKTASGGRKTKRVGGCGGCGGNAARRGCGRDGRMRGGFSRQDEDPTYSRRAARKAARASGGSGHRHAHGGEAAVAEARNRLRIKALEKQLAKRDCTDSLSERVGILREVAKLNAESQRTSQAISAYQEILRLAPEDEHYMRTALLCLLMDQARGDEATELLKGPLFAPLLSSTIDEETPSFPRTCATTAGRYSVTLLSYISTCVLKEHKHPGKAAAAEQRLFDRLRSARAQNVFVAEFLAFAPAFQPHFPSGCELPPREACTSAEEPLLDALQYCCHHGQVTVWLDTDDEVRRFLRQKLFEEEDETNEHQDGPPLGPLPPEQTPEPILLARWRRAREDALELWMTEMSVDASSDGAEDCNGESSEGAESDDSSTAVLAAEERQFG